jgi:hypothetical protein
LNIRTAIFASVASAGVVASGWIGVTAGPAAAAPTARPANVAQPAPAGSLPAAPGRTRHAAAVSRDRLVSGESVQLVGSALYTVDGYAASLQAAVDRGLAGA